MDTNIIRESISAAKRHEAESAHLAETLSSRLNGLHHAIRLPAENVIPVLLSFVTRYIDHVPDFIDAVDGLSESSALREYTEPVTGAAKAFFTQPPELINNRQGLDALMDEAYLAHRLVEEVNDRFISGTGSLLVPMDMTRSNLIIHHLIGEPFANQLDQAVHLIAQHLHKLEEVICADNLRQSLSRAAHKLTCDLKRWPCLIDTLSIQFVLNRGITP